jgi:tetratricopeptide (TPR) repeat protein/predicted DNA-binding WGR domain protein
MKKRFLNYKTDEFWQIKVAANLLITVQGSRGRIGKKTLRNYVNDRKCLKEAEKLMVDKKKQGYHESLFDFIHKPEVPQSLRDGLSKREIIKTTCQKFEIFPIHRVALITIIVNANPVSSTASQGGLDVGKGYYCQTAYALGRSFSKTKLPEHLLVWLPESGLYGLWCRNDRELYVFPETDWAGIENNLPVYLCPQQVKEVFPPVHSCLNIEDHFIFIPEDFAPRIKQILSLSGESRQQKVEGFLAQYEQRLLDLPYTDDLEKEFSALVTFYYHIGQWLEGDSEYEKAIKWFQKALIIMNQAPPFRILYSDIFLQLSFCCLETSQFDLALLYIDLFSEHDTSSAEACHRIKMNICRTQQLYKETMNAYLKQIEQRSEYGYKQAGKLIQRTIQAAPDDPILHFNLACFYSSSNRIKEALYHLEEAFKKGYKNHEKVISDLDLENIRSTREYEDIRLKYLFVLS